MRHALWLVGLVFGTQGLAAPGDGADWSPAPVPGLAYTEAFFPGTRYRESVPTAEALLGYGVGTKAATAGEVERCLKAWVAAAPDRARWVEYARSWEGRPLGYVVITAPRHLERLEAIQEGLARLGDPRKTSEAEAGKLVDELPAVAWLSYTIHGDETEGSDAALALVYHLIAAEGGDVEALREAVVILIDPLMNPDGRDRFLKRIAERRGAAPNVDDQSMVHRGDWPYGRGNHYLFDLNRDWIHGVHPETRGRIREVARWHPQLFVDAHGMGAQDTHLFSPPREPINPHLPRGRMVWAQRFVADQATAMDRQPWLYYTGEWNEEWFPGYSDGWASYRGAVGILYEQARIAEDGVLRPEGRILSYRESVHHHVVGSMANLGTLQRHGRELRRQLYETRRQALATDGPYARRTFAVLPSANRSRWQALDDLLALQGIERHRLDQALEVGAATDWLGRTRTNVTLPAGTMLVGNRQPLGHLVAALLEFDTRLSPEVLREERQELLRKGESRIYDTTAWNLPMLSGLESLTLPLPLPDVARPWTGGAAAGDAAAGAAGEALGWVFDGADDLSVAIAARLLERGVEVRMADKAFEFSGVRYARGSVVVLKIDNRAADREWAALVAAVSKEVGLAGAALTTGLGAGDLPDLGGRHFRRLERPRLALWSGSGVSSTDYGSLWHAVDQRLGIRHSHLAVTGGSDLSRYNVLVLPEAGAGAWSSQTLTNLKTWVESGGTLIAIGDSVSPLVAEPGGLSDVRQIAEVLGRLPDYEQAVWREWLAQDGGVPAEERVWGHAASPGVKYPWPGSGGWPEEKELKRRDAWQQLFMPQGAILASRVDTNHWLTVGCGEMMPVLTGNNPVLMAAGVEAPVRFGYWTRSGTKGVAAGDVDANLLDAEDAKDAQGAKDGKDEGRAEKKGVARVGWCALPPGTELRLRMSGLLWPEAAARIANSAWVTREGLGRGQIILFASPPTFRGASRAMARVWLNAVVYGPGCGTAATIRP